MKAIIMAGGKGTRLAALTKDEIPKPMVLVKGRPLLEWQMDRLKAYNITDITLVIGHLGEKIESYFGDGAAFGLNISYIREETPLGTAGSFYYLSQRLRGANNQVCDREGQDADCALLIMGDLIFDFDIPKMLNQHRQTGADITLLAHPNMHPYDSDLLKTDKTHRVIAIDSKSNVRDYYYDNLVNAGICICEPDVFHMVTEPVKLNFERDIVAPLIAENKVYAYRTTEYVKDVGTVERILQAADDIDKGIVSGKNLKNKQRAIFLDRDGVINVNCGFVTKPEQLILEEKAIDGIKLINSSAYLAICTTNQPIIARGDCTVDELDNIFNRMKTLLGEGGAYLDDIYYCPHHPDKGFPGERIEYKTDCDCRKPKPGLFLEAAKRYNIDLSNSWVIGDRTTDLEAGRRAGCKTALVLTGEAGEDGKWDKTSDIVADDIYAAVAEILKY